MNQSTAVKGHLDLVGQIDEERDDEQRGHGRGQHEQGQLGGGLEALEGLLATVGGSHVPYRADGRPA